MRPLADQTILITGATDGLGKALAAELAATGARLLLHGRDDRKGADTVRDIQHRTRNAQLHWYRADLSSLRETADLAQRVTDTCGQLDTLINNAGIGFTSPGDGRRVESQDGHELRFAVNYLAPYLLTRHLEALLRRSAPARVVNVASAGQEPIDFGDVMLERGYDGVRAYRQSKLALVMFTLDLAAELAGSGVTVKLPASGDVHAHQDGHRLHQAAKLSRGRPPGHHAADRQPGPGDRDRQVLRRAAGGHRLGSGI